MDFSKSNKRKWLGKSILYFDCLDSTNMKMSELAPQSSHGLVVVAGEQNAGKGRRGRTWISEPNTGIYMSVLLKPDLAPAKASGLTLVAALSVVKAIEKVTKIQPNIKWPNDVVMNGKKISGILTEMILSKNEVDSIIIGIGVNVSNQTFPEEIKNMASSLLVETGLHMKRHTLIEEILDAFEMYYEKYMQMNDFSLLQEEYERYLINKNEKVCVLEPSGQYEGIALGITKTGELLVRTSHEVKTVYAGEVSVRGIYGYV